MTTTAATPTTQGPEIVAKPSGVYRAKQAAMAILLIGWGLWSVYDGYYNWPRQNQEIADLKEQIKKKPKDDPAVTEMESKLAKLKEHTNLDIKFNQVLGWALPPIGLVLLVRAFYVSRGVYRLRDDVLHVPGHPPVPLDGVKAIDKSKWDRKGIAKLNYELMNGKRGRLTIDDYIYDRGPTDDIMKRVEEYTGLGGAAPVATTTEPTSQA
jgi:hypothetical protein